MYRGLAAIAQTVVLTVALLASSAPVSAQSLPPIPDLSNLNWESISPSVREPLRHAYEKVRSHPDDGEAAGQLGMALQALEQFGTAATCYDRALRLEPRAFRWTYYSAVAKAAQGEQAEAIERFRTAVEQKPDYLP